MFEAIAGVLLLISAVVVWALTRRLAAAQQDAAAAETKAAMSWGEGFRAATDEVNIRRDREDRASYDKGFEKGWNACIAELQQQENHKEVAAA